MSTISAACHHVIFFASRSRNDFLYLHRGLPAIGGSIRTPAIQRVITSTTGMLLFRA
jgi:hypothetical protein